MRSKAYENVAVNDVDDKKLGKEHDGQDVTVGLDMGKYRLMATNHWPDGTSDRPSGWCRIQFGFASWPPW